MSHFSHYPNRKFPNSIAAPTWCPISPTIQTGNSQTALLHLCNVAFLPLSKQQIPKQHYCTYVMSHFSHLPYSKFPNSITAPTWCPISPIIQTANSEKALLHLRDVPFLPLTKQQAPKQHYCTYVMSHFSHYPNSKLRNSITAPTWCPISPTIQTANSQTALLNLRDVPFLAPPFEQIPKNILYNNVMSHFSHHPNNKFEQSIQISHCWTEVTHRRWRLPLTSRFIVT